MATTQVQFEGVTLLHKSRAKHLFSTLNAMTGKSRSMRLHIYILLFVDLSPPVYITCCSSFIVYDQSLAYLAHSWTGSKNESCGWKKFQTRKISRDYRI